MNSRFLLRAGRRTRPGLAANSAEGTAMCAGTRSLSASAAPSRPGPVRMPALNYTCTASAKPRLAGGCDMLEVVFVRIIL